MSGRSDYDAALPRRGCVFCVEDDTTCWSLITLESCLAEIINRQEFSSRHLAQPNVTRSAVVTVNYGTSFVFNTPAHSLSICRVQVAFCHCTKSLSARVSATRQTHPSFAIHPFFFFCCGVSLLQIATEISSAHYFLTATIVTAFIGPFSNIPPNLPHLPSSTIPDNDGPSLRSTYLGKTNRMSSLL